MQINSQVQGSQYLATMFGQINIAANTAFSEANDVANAVVIAEGYANAVWLLRCYS